MFGNSFGDLFGGAFGSLFSGPPEPLKSLVLSKNVGQNLTLVDALHAKGLRPLLTDITKWELDRQGIGKTLVPNPEKGKKTQSTPFGSMMQPDTIWVGRDAYDFEIEYRPEEKTVVINEKGKKEAFATIDANTPVIAGTLGVLYLDWYQNHYALKDLAERQALAFAVEVMK